MRCLLRFGRLSFGLSALLAVAGLWAPQISQAEIIIDFSHDASTNNFFGTDTADRQNARAAILKAAEDINNILKATLGPVSPSDYSLTGTSSTGSGETTVTLDTTLSYLNPATNMPETFNPVGLGVDEIRIFVGARPMSNPGTPSDPINNALGEGGPGSVETMLVASTTNGFASLAAALDDVESQSNAIFTRGDGPLNFGSTGTLSGESYQLDYTTNVGSLWFDNDTDNDGLVDSASQLASSWHFDSASNVAAGKNDLYSVAVHEILHVLGAGTSVSWNNNVAPFGSDDGEGSTDWLGPNVAELLGSGSGIIAIDGVHLTASTVSNRVSDGASQAPVLQQALPTGTRREVTELDVALLRDIGWQGLAVEAVPEPEAFAFLGLSVLAAVTRRNRGR